MAKATKRKSRVVIKLGSLVRFDQASIIVWVKKREAPGRAKHRVEFDTR